MKDEYDLVSNFLFPLSLLKFSTGSDVDQEVSRLLGDHDDVVLRRLTREFISAAHKRLPNDINFVSLNPDDPAWPLTCQLSEKRGNLGLVLSLRNIFREWQDQLENDINRQGIIAKWVDLIANGPPKRSMTELGFESLRPAIKNIIELYIMRLSTLVNYNFVLDIPHKLIAGDLAVVIVKDLPAGIALCSNDDLAPLGLTFDQALEHAIANLNKLDSANDGSKFENISKNIVASTFGDSYDSSRIMNPDTIFRGVPFNSDEAIVFVPDRDQIIVANQNDLESVKTAYTRGEDRMNDAAKPISVTGLKLDKTTSPPSWTVFDPSTIASKLDTSSQRMMQRMEQIQRARFYQTQRDLLEKWDESKPDKVFHARVIATMHDGEVSSYATWTRGLATTLPKVDYLLLVEEERDGAPLARQIKFDVALKELPHLIHEFSDEEKAWVSPSFLPRYYVVSDPDAWPTEDQFSAMGAKKL